MQSKNNLELKYMCEDFSKIRTVLKSIGAQKEIVKKQKDYFFNLPAIVEKKSGRLKLRLENESQILVFYTRPDFSEKSKTVAEVSLYEVKDKDFLPFLIMSHGIKGIVEKKREVWRLDNTVFHLDTVKGVGSIFEVELQKHGKITDKDIKLFNEFKSLLMPHLGKIVKGSNIDLVLK